MLKIVIVVIATLIPVAPMVAYFLNRFGKDSLKTTKDLVLAFKGYNVMILLMVVGLGLVWLASPSTALAAGLPLRAATDPYASLAAGISAGLGSVGAGLAVGGTGAAAIGAVAEKPGFLGISLIYVGLAEGIAIYGLLIAFLVLYT
jgi:V/A-type H+/Na+-transporting ATPase subunit K